MARPYQGDDVDPFSGAEDELESRRKAPKFDLERFKREQAAAQALDDRDKMEMAMTSGGRGALKQAPQKSNIVTKEQLKASGYSNLRDYLNAQKGLTRRGDKSRSDELAGMDTSAKARAATPAKEKKGSEIIADKQEKAAPKMAKAYQDMSIKQGVMDVLKSFGFYKNNPEGRNFGDISKNASEARAKRKEEDVDSTMMKKGGQVMNESKLMKKEGRGMAKASMQKIASKAVKGHEKRMHGMKSGGAVSPASKRADGIAVRGKTRCKIC